MKSLIVTLVVSMVLVCLEKIAKKNDKRGTKKKYVIRLPFSYFYIGVACNAFFAVLLICLDFNGQAQEDPISFRCLAAFLLLGFYLIALTLPRIWDIQVDGDKIQIIKCIIFKKNFLFSDIERCKVTNGLIKVYIRGRKRQAFCIDKLMSGAYVFYSQVEVAGIPIQNLVKKEVES